MTAVRTLKAQGSAVGSRSGRPELTPPVSQLGRLDSLTRRHPNGRNRAQTRCQRQPVRAAGSGGLPTFAEAIMNRTRWKLRRAEGYDGICALGATFIPWISALRPATWRTRRSARVSSGVFSTSKPSQNYGFKQSTNIGQREAAAGVGREI
jgi:hypothetical protein